MIEKRALCHKLGNENIEEWKNYIKYIFCFDIENIYFVGENCYKNLGYVRKVFEMISQENMP